MRNKKSKCSSNQRSAKSAIKFIVGSNVEEIARGISNASPADFKNSVIIYEISRKEIESCNTERINNDLKPDPNSVMVKHGMGKVDFRATGYECEERELFHLPKFRKFMVRMQVENPCWLYYNHVSSFWLHYAALSVCDNSATLQRTGDKRIECVFSNENLASFLNVQLLQFLELWDASGRGLDEIIPHLDAMHELLGVERR